MKRNVLRVGGILTLALLTWLIAGFSSAQQACAHDPRFVCSPRAENDAVRISTPTKSWAFYGHLRDGQSDTYSASLDHAARIPWSLLIDDRDAANPARPSAQLYDAAGKLVEELLFAPTEAFYEAFSREHYQTTKPHWITLRAGTYRIVVLMHGGHAPQRYTMALGEQELFGVADIPFVLGALHRIRSLNY